MEANGEILLLSREAIARKAYELFEQRGCEHGHDVEDWLQAEAELAQGSSASGEGRPPQIEPMQPGN